MLGELDQTVEAPRLSAQVWSVGWKDAEVRRCWQAGGPFRSRAQSLLHDVRRLVNALPQREFG